MSLPLLWCSFNLLILISCGSGSRTPFGTKIDFFVITVDESLLLAEFTKNFILEATDVPDRLCQNYNMTDVKSVWANVPSGFASGRLFFRVNFARVTAVIRWTPAGHLALQKDLSIHGMFHLLDKRPAIILLLYSRWKYNQQWHHTIGS